MKAFLSILTLVVLSFALAGCSLMTDTVILDPDMVEALEKDGATKVSCDESIPLKKGESGSCKYTVGDVDYERTVSIGRDGDFKSIYISNIMLSADGESVEADFNSKGEISKCVSNPGEACTTVSPVLKEQVPVFNKTLRDSLEKSE